MAEFVEKQGKRILKRDVDPLPAISNPIKLEPFKRFVKNFLRVYGKLKDEFLVKYTNDMTLFVKAFTDISVDANNNYEMLEMQGDAVVNKCALTYLTNRFPDIYNQGARGIEIFSKQKPYIVDKKGLAIISQELGLPEFIQYRPLPYSYQNDSNVYYVSVTDSTKEDVFEAFMGAIEKTIDDVEDCPGVGYVVVYSIMANIYSHINIPSTIHELYDPKTKLKEVFDATKGINEDESVYQDKLNYKIMEVNGMYKVTLIIMFDQKNEINVKANRKILEFESDLFVKDPNKIKFVEKELANKALRALQNKYPGEFYWRNRPESNNSSEKFWNP